jgi:hypothetical protein
MRENLKGRNHLEDLGIDGKSWVWECRLAQNKVHREAGNSLISCVGANFSKLLVHRTAAVSHESMRFLWYRLFAVFILIHSFMHQTQFFLSHRQAFWSRLYWFGCCMLCLWNVVSFWWCLMLTKQPEVMSSNTAQENDWSCFKIIQVCL